MAQDDSTLLRQIDNPEKCLRVVRMLLNQAMDDELIHRNVALRIRIPRPNRESITVLTPAEIDRLAQAMPDQWRAFVYVMAYGGLRFSEAAGLRVHRVNFLRRQVRIESKVVEVEGQVFEGEPKTEAGRRTISLSPFVMDLLADHVGRWPPVPPDHGLVFHNRDGGPVRRSNFYRRARRTAVASAGLDGFKVKNLRHTGASLAVAGGADLHHLKVRMGHASIATTSRFYIELYEGQDAEIAERLDALARDPQATQRRLRPS